MSINNTRTCNHHPQPQVTLDNDSSHAIANLKLSDHHSDTSLAYEGTPDMLHPTVSRSPSRSKAKRHAEQYPRNPDQVHINSKFNSESMHLSEYAAPPKRPRTQDPVDTVEWHQYQPTETHNELFMVVDATIEIESQEPRSILSLPFELIIMTLRRIFNPLDLWRFSQTCTAIRNLIDEKLWRDLYIMQSPIWSLDVQINHLMGGVKMWSRMVISDYLRRTLHWVELSSNLTQAVEDKKLLRADLGSCRHYRPPHMHSAISVSSAESQQWRNVGPPALFTDQSTNTTLAAYMQARSCVGRTDHQIAVYGQSDHNTPITIIPSSFWAHKDADKQLEPELATENLGPAQLKDMKHFPAKDGRMRVVFVVAFGERNQMPADADDRDMYIVDVWSLLRIFEVYIPPPTFSSGSTAGSIPIRGRVETIAPRSRQEVIRIRIVKIYSAINQSSGQSEDRIALIGIHQGSRLRTVLMTSPLLATSQPIAGYTKGYGSSVRPSSWECHVLGGMQALEPSCMALFPAQSDFERLLVILDQHGNGEIWDWMRRVRVSVLQLRTSTVLQPHRENLYYWGVHVNWAIEEPVYNESALPFNLGSSRRACGDFRVVALSDGASNEWESCWWNISEKDLREHLSQEPVPIAAGQTKVHLTSEHVFSSDAQVKESSSPEDVPSTASQSVLQSSSESVPKPWTIESSSRHFEYCTRGVLYPQHNSSAETPSCQQPETDGVPGTPLMFIAYLIWDHYRIALTAEYGICIFDMDQEASCDILNDDVKRAPQWVTMIEGAEEDPLIDIATVGNCLFLTRKYSHMVWVF